MDLTHNLLKLYRAACPAIARDGCAVEVGMRTGDDQTIRGQRQAACVTNPMVVTSENGYY